MEVPDTSQQLNTTTGQTPPASGTAGNLSSTSLVSSNIPTNFIKEFLRPNKFKLVFFLLVYFLPAAFYLMIQQSAAKGYFAQAPFQTMVSLLGLVLVLPVNIFKFLFVSGSVSWLVFFVLLAVSGIAFWVSYYLLGCVINLIFNLIFSLGKKLFSPKSVEASK